MTKFKKILKIYSLVFTLLGLTGLSLNQACSSAVYQSKDIRMNTITHSSQYHDGKFHNTRPWNSKPGLSTMLDFLFSRNERTPKDSLPRQNADLTLFCNRADDQLNVTWLGHSSLMINIDGFRILTDPVFENKVSFLGPSRFNGQLPLHPDQLDSVDVVLISHNHYDHLNKWSIKQLKDKTDRFIVPLAVGAQLEKWGVDRNKITELDWWQDFTFHGELNITATPAQHFSGRGLTDRDETLWASFVVRGPHHNIFYGGDGGYFEGFKKIGRQYGPFDMTFLECGAYNVDWIHIHMMPEQTAQAHLDLQGKILHPIHWGTFNLALHPWYEPMQRISRAADSLDITLATPIVGGTTVYDKPIVQNRWWESQLVKTNMPDRLIPDSTEQAELKKPMMHGATR